MLSRQRISTSITARFRRCSTFRLRPPGENDIVSIIGANGAGKTTLMKTIMGVNSPARGTDRI